MNQNKKSTFVVGEGFLPFVLAKFLEKRGVYVDRLMLGGNSFLSSLVFPRALEPETLPFFEDLIPSMKWHFIEEKIVEWTKGKWSEIATKPSSDLMESFFSRPFYVPDFLEDRSMKNAGVDELRIELKEKQIWFRKKIFYFEKIYWCLPPQKLNEAIGEPITQTKSNQFYVGIEMELDESLATPESSVFPFRFKEEKFRALGTNEIHTWKWVIPLPEQISEDAEEIAKAVRAFRRDLNNAFPNFKNLSSKVRIIEEPVSYEINDRSCGFQECAPGIYFLPCLQNSKSKEKSFVTADSIARYCQNLKIDNNLERPDGIGFSIENNLRAG